MYNLLRRIAFPQDIEVSGPVIKASVIDHVGTHTDLIRKAEQRAQHLITAAQAEAQHIRASTQQEAARALQADVTALRQLTQDKDLRQQQIAGELCTNICKTVLTEVFEALPELDKIGTLVDALLTRAHLSRELQLQCHPEHVHAVQTQLAQRLADQLHLKRWSVQDNAELPRYTLRIATSNGAETMVSLDNLMALYIHEINHFSSEIQVALSAEHSHER